MHNGRDEVTVKFRMVLFRKYFKQVILLPLMLPLGLWLEPIYWGVVVIQCSLECSLNVVYPQAVHYSEFSSHLPNLLNGLISLTLTGDLVGHLRTMF